MQTTLPHFDSLKPETPKVNDVTVEYALIKAAFDAAIDIRGRVAAIKRWDALRIKLGTWQSVVHARFTQDTNNEDYKAAKDQESELSPKFLGPETEFKQILLKSPHRAELEKEFGAQAFHIWENDVLTFDPKIEADLVAESKLVSKYTSLKSGAQIPFRGESYNLSRLAAFAMDADRTTRQAASEAQWDWFTSNAAELDAIYSELVKHRHTMSQKLGFRNYVEMAYRMRQRNDYDEAAVAKFRAQVRDDIVPLALALKQTQAKDLGIEKVMSWDEKVWDLEGSPRPKGDHDWMVAHAQTMFDELGNGMGEFFALMRERGLLDLKARDGKAGGGYCTSITEWGLPFIFANFNGTSGDITVFTHEMGHAYQNYCSRKQCLSDYFWPSYDAAEVHSMSLEYLTWPWMDKFFGKDDADRFRRQELLGKLAFLPYGVAVDHFQHLVYAEPDATSQRRHQMWQEMERTYLPWRHYGGMSHVNQGGMWQAQSHIYRTPFYYIDYVLAETCAMQFWVRADKDRAGAMQDYVALCSRGGEAPFQSLVRGAGLVSPFDEGCLSDVVGQAKRWLGV
jgi:M3 family oligoendopeptidase